MQIKSSLIEVCQILQISKMFEQLFQQYFFHTMWNSKDLIKNPKGITTLQLASTFTKNEQQRGRLLKQLEQLGLDLSEYHNLSLKQLTTKTQFIMSNTYSIKYLGLNKNEMGIVSRRINPLTDQDLKIQGDVTENYSVHKYFYPKPLRTGKKAHADKNLNVDNLQSQIKRQFEQKRTKHLKKDEEKRSKQNREDKNRTKMAGSWYSNFGDFKKKAYKTDGLNSVAENIQTKVDPTQSFSRFLSKGILIVRD